MTKQKSQKYKWVRYNEDIKPVIKTGDLYYTSAHNLYSYIIQLVTDSKISHVGMFLWVGDRLFAIECVASGCVMQLASNRFGKSPLVIQRTNIKPNVDIALDSIGKVEYDWLGAILSPIIRLKRNEEYCVEFIESIFNIQIGPVDRNVYPIDCFKYFKSKKNK